MLVSFLCLATEFSDMELRASMIYALNIPAIRVFSNSKVVYGSRRDGGEASTRNPSLCLANFGRLKRSAKTCNWWTNGFHMILPSLSDRSSFTSHPLPIGVVKSTDECSHDTTPFRFPITWRACGSSLQFMVHGIISNYRKSISRMWSMNKVAKAVSIDCEIGPVRLTMAERSAS